jgi:hypothetical protein
MRYVQRNGVGQMTAFDEAWLVAKAPWIDGGSTHVPSGKPVIISSSLIDGPLYSGGDTWDEPRYWTDDVSEALAYAMFGSAIPRGIKNAAEFRNRVKMRETIPQIMVAPDPGDAWRGKDGHIDESLLDENDDIQNYILHSDPESEAYMHDEHWGAPEHAPMPADELEAMIQQIVDSGDDHFRWGNTGTYMSDGERRIHINEALHRLQTNTRGQTDLPDEVKHLVETSETDQITGDDEEDYLREWGRWE